MLERVRVPYALEILPREFIQAYVCIKKLGPYKEDVVLLESIPEANSCLFEFALGKQKAF